MIIANHGGIPASRNATARYTCHHERVSIRCLLVDDSDAFLEAASDLLQREGVTVVGVASSSAEALRQAGALRPDVVLVDIGLGTESSFDLARLLAQDGQAGGAEVILISARAEADYASWSPKARQPDSWSSRSSRPRRSAGSSAGGYNPGPIAGGRRKSPERKSPELCDGGLPSRA